MSEPIIEYRDEFNVMDFASKYAERVSRVIDEQTLANVDHQLAEFGYVKVVRCMNCVFFEAVPEDPGDWCGYWTDRVYGSTNGFCAWGDTGYLCDLCRHNGGSFGGGEIECTYDAGAHVTGHVQKKLVIDHGKQDPLEICKHFEREVVDE